TPLRANITLLHTATHVSKNVSKTHVDSSYYTFDEIKDQRFDGMIVTGAPIEHLPFEQVKYWDELTNIMDWSIKNVTSVFYICWGAQAVLYHLYGIGKREIGEKCFGIFE